MSLQIHRFYPRTLVDKIMKALRDIVQSGKVRYIDASSMHMWQVALINEVVYGWTKFVIMQNKYLLLY